MTQKVEEGFMVFVADGELGIGAVREVIDGGDQLVINIQNGGDFTIPRSAVRDVHSAVILDVAPGTDAAGRARPSARCGIPAVRGARPQAGTPRQ